MVIQQAPAAVRVMAVQFKENPVNTVCPGCQEQIVTQLSYSIGREAIWWCACLFFTGYVILRCAAGTYYLIECIYVAYYVAGLPLCIDFAS